MASLVISILSWILCPFVGALVGFFLGLSAKGDIARTGQAGGGMATAGMVISAVHFFSLDSESDELEYLCATVQVLKGRHDYAGGPDPLARS